MTGRDIVHGAWLTVTLACPLSLSPCMHFAAIIHPWRESVTKLFCSAGLLLCHRSPVILHTGRQWCTGRGGAAARTEFPRRHDQNYSGVKMAYNTANTILTKYSFSPTDEVTTVVAHKECQSVSSLSHWLSHWVSVAAKYGSSVAAARALTHHFLLSCRVNASAAAVGSNNNNNIWGSQL